jgi:N-acetylneuraminic acid mutarotase
MDEGHLVKTTIQVLVFMLLACSVRAEMTFDWRRGPDLPSARDHLGCGMVDGMLVVAGGAYWRNEQKHYSADTIAYSPKTGKWIRLPFLPKPGAYGASAVIQDQLLIAGGANETGVLSSCIRLARRNGSFRWERLPDLPRPLFGSQGASIGDAFYAVGGAPGMDESGTRAAEETMLILLQSGSPKWRACQAVPPRVGAAVASCGDRVFVFGGYGVQPDGTLGNFSDAWRFDSLKWKRLRDMPAPARWTTAIALDSTHVGLFGGYGEGFLDKVFVYDTETDAYTETTPLPLPVANLAGGVADGTVYLAGGEDLQRHRSAALFMGRIMGR